LYIHGFLHIAAGLPTIHEYHNEEQQFDEIEYIMEWMVDKWNPILMGDFNHGPVAVARYGSRKTSQWLLPFNYGLMIARGMISPYAISSGLCTYCRFSKETVQSHIYIPTHTVAKAEYTKVRVFL